MISANELRQKYFDFFISKGHVVIPTSSLIPENDPSVLFTTAGMHPLVPYLLGQPHPQGKRLVSCQKCLRTDDIDEVGDAFHHTFLEMLGNWSLGDYFKKEAITWSYEFLIKTLKLDPNRLIITCFAGDNNAPKDNTSAETWQSLGIAPDKIIFLDKKSNWWGPVGNTGPCGPDTEMHYDLSQKSCGPDCLPGCSCGRFSEIWNDVFMEYNKTASGKFEKLKNPNVDTGMGLERVLAIINGFDDDYLTEIWQPIIQKISSITGKDYQSDIKNFRIIADHFRASVFLVADGIEPSNKDRGYILRRLLRRAIFQLHRLGSDSNDNISDLINIIIDTNANPYQELITGKEKILSIIQIETQKFNQSLTRGMKEFNRLPNIDALSAFNLFQTFGFPLELTLELAKEKGQTINQAEFFTEFRKHQDLSRATSAGMFKGGLADQSEITTRYHTATHLLHQALIDVLGNHIHQAGSNITADRLRFDFSHTNPLSTDELTQVETIINQKISENLPITSQIMTYQEAIEAGAKANFKDRYPDEVTVYSIGNYSREVCGGPHVTATGQIGSIKIIRQESMGAAIRRLYLQFA
jgi:alanyl-tRNA synthetase